METPDSSASTSSTGSRPNDQPGISSDPEEHVWRCAFDAKGCIAHGSRSRGCDALANPEFRNHMRQPASSQTQDESSSFRSRGAVRLPRQSGQALRWSADTHLVPVPEVPAVPDGIDEYASGHIARKIAGRFNDRYAEAVRCFCRYRQFDLHAFRRIASGRANARGANVWAMRSRWVILQSMASQKSGDGNAFRDVSTDRRVEGNPYTRSYREVVKQGGPRHEN